MDTTLTDIDAVQPDEMNVRTHSERNIQAIADSLTEFGQRRPLVVWKDTVIAGNGTLAAAKQIGWKEIVVTRVPDDWDLDRARAYAIADNRTAELADWDKPMLGQALMDLEQSGWDIPTLGFDPLNNDANEDENESKLGSTTYAVIIDCTDEGDQLALLSRFEDEGLKARPLMM
jgi:ParB-like chromosome segregation protein Spo0J